MLKQSVKVIGAEHLRVVALYSEPLENVLQAHMPYLEAPAVCVCIG